MRSGSHFPLSFSDIPGSCQPVIIEILDKWHPRILLKILHKVGLTVKAQLCRLPDRNLFPKMFPDVLQYPLDFLSCMSRLLLCKQDASAISIIQKQK